MFTTRLFRLLMIVAITMVTACTPQIAATPNATSAPVATSAQDEPVTLRLAVADAEGGRSDPYVHEFIDQVRTLSNDMIAIEPIWEAAGSWSTGDPMNAYFEFGVIQLVREGNFELGLAGSRAFDLHGITSFQALQAPFLIDNDALLEAVTTSDIATRMLDHLSSSGMTGLTLWPEDLRHPFSLIPEKPILAPEDFKGLKVRAIPSNVTYALIETLGGNAKLSDSDYQAAESGLRQGASLTGTPTATGNVTFFAKYQVLFVSDAAFEKLSETQRKVLRDAAMATQMKAIAEHPSDVDTAQIWCADGGTVVMASEAQVAAFEAAAQPIFASLENDPLNAELIAALRELKAKTEASPGASACAPETGSANPGRDVETQVWSQGTPPSGVWRVELTTDDFVSMGVLRSVAEAEWAGTYEFVFEDGKGTHRAQGKTWIMECPFTFEVTEDFVRISFVDLGLGNYDCGTDRDDVQWRLDGDGLHLHLVATHGEAPIVELTAMYEAKPWQKVAAP